MFKAKHPGNSGQNQRQLNLFEDDKICNDTNLISYDILTNFCLRSAPIKSNNLSAGTELIVTSDAAVVTWSRANQKQRWSPRGSVSVVFEVAQCGGSHAVHSLCCVALHLKWLQLKMKGPILLILTVWLNSPFGGSAPPSSCSYPPSEWCSSLEAAAQCGVRVLIPKTFYVLSMENAAFQRQWLKVLTIVVEKPFNLAFKRLLT